eukprot:2071762-Amphidinium_carterae.1
MARKSIVVSNVASEWGTALSTVRYAQMGMEDRIQISNEGGHTLELNRLTLSTEGPSSQPSAQCCSKRTCLSLCRATPPTTSLRRVDQRVSLSLAMAVSNIAAVSAPMPAPRPKFCTTNLCSEFRIIPDPTSFLGAWAARNRGTHHMSDKWMDVNFSGPMVGTALVDSLQQRSLVSRIEING